VESIQPPFRGVTEASLWVRAAEAQANHLTQPVLELKRVIADKSVDLHRNSITFCVICKALGLLLLLE